MRIAVDAMGGDRAPQAVVEGAVLAARQLGIGVLLVGDRARVEPELKRHNPERLDIELRHASEVVAMDESPVGALRKSDSSLRVGLLTVREREAAAFVFSGNTGAGMVLGAQLLGCVEGIERPAIAALVPALSGHTVLLDAGANVDCRPVHLAQLAVMGDAYARAVRHIPAPRIGLLSNGIEESKGNALVRAAAPLLRQLPINFVGYVEGREISSGAVDVLVCDGFVGNVLLKGLEGFGHLVAERLETTFRAGLRGRIAHLLVGKTVRGLSHDLDARETGGALLLGLSGVVVKAHGASDARAICNAIARAAELARSEVVAQVGRAIAGTIALAEPAIEKEPRGLWRTLRRRLRREDRDRTPAPAPAPGLLESSVDVRDGRMDGREGPTTTATPTSNQTSAAPTNQEQPSPSPVVAAADQNSKQPAEKSR